MDTPHVSASSFTVAEPRSLMRAMIFAYRSSDSISTNLHKLPQIYDHYRAAARESQAFAEEKVTKHKIRFYPTKKAINLLRLYGILYINPLTEEVCRRAIVVTSGKGGVGKTTLTAALGKVLAENGQRTVLLDADIGLNNLDVLMNVENRITFDITDVVENRCRPRQALVEDPFTRGLFVLPSAHGYDSGAINGQALRAVIRSLLKTFDYCFVDCPAGVEAGFHRAVTACDEALVVVTPHISSVRDADKVLRLLAGYGIGADVVINRARGDLMLTEEMIPVGEVARALSVTPIGVIPESDRHQSGQQLRLSVRLGHRRSDTHPGRKPHDRFAHTVRRHEKIPRSVGRSAAGLKEKDMNDVRERLGSALISDRAGEVETVLKVLKSDFYSILSEYAEVDPATLSITADLYDGAVRVTVSASLTSVRAVGNILPD